MRKTLSLFTAAAMLFSCISITAAADDTGADNIITADKTAQWRNNPGDGSYDLRIHGWRDWAVSYTHLDVYKRQTVDLPLQ